MVCYCLGILWHHTVLVCRVVTLQGLGLLGCDIITNCFTFVSPEGVQAQKESNVQKFSGISKVFLGLCWFKYECLSVNMLA